MPPTLPAGPSFAKSQISHVPEMVIFERFELRVARTRRHRRNFQYTNALQRTTYGMLKATRISESDKWPFFQLFIESTIRKK
jgi:hypothetical protein